MHRLKKIITFLIMLLTVVIADCTCQRKQIVVRSVLLKIPPSIGKSLPNKEKFTALVQQVISKNPKFHFDAYNADGKTMQIIMMVPSDRHTPSIILYVVLKEKSKEYSSFADIQIIDGKIGGADIRLRLNQALKNLYEIRNNAQLTGSVYFEKIKAAADGTHIERSELLNAIAIVKSAKDKTAAASLIKLLSYTNDSVVGNACLIALGELAVKEAMPAIIQFVERKRPMVVRQGIVAARRIASQRAAEWLLVIAYGYGDPTVRREALSALHEVEKKLKLHKN